MPEPRFQDRVKHRTSMDLVTGTVIAKYRVYNKQMLDIRTDDGKIKYKTPAENWETIATEEQTWRD